MSEERKYSPMPEDEGTEKLQEDVEKKKKEDLEREEREQINNLLDKEGAFIIERGKRGSVYKVVPIKKNGEEKLAVKKSGTDDYKIIDNNTYRQNFTHASGKNLSTFFEDFTKDQQGEICKEYLKVVRDEMDGMSAFIKKSFFGRYMDRSVEKRKRKAEEKLLGSHKALNEIGEELSRETPSEASRQKIAENAKNVSKNVSWLFNNPDTLTKEAQEEMVALREKMEKVKEDKRLDNYREPGKIRSTLDNSIEKMMEFVKKVLGKIGVKSPENPVQEESPAGSPSMQ